MLSVDETDKGIKKLLNDDLAKIPVVLISKSNFRHTRWVFAKNKDRKTGQGKKLIKRTKSINYNLFRTSVFALKSWVSFSDFFWLNSCLMAFCPWSSFLVFHPRYHLWMFTAAFLLLLSLSSSMSSSRNNLGISSLFDIDLLGLIREFPSTMSKSVILWSRLLVTVRKLSTSSCGKFLSAWLLVLCAPVHQLCSRLDSVGDCKNKGGTGAGSLRACHHSSTSSGSKVFCDVADGLSGKATWLALAALLWRCGNLIK